MHVFQKLLYPLIFLSCGSIAWGKTVEISIVNTFASGWHWIVFVICLLYLYNTNKKYINFVDKKSIAVQYEAPKGFSLLQSNYILNASTKSKNINAAILELGYLGYLKIRQKHQYFAPNIPVVKSTNKKVENLTLDQKYLLKEILFKNSSSFEMSKNSNKIKNLNKKLHEWSISNGYKMKNSFLKNILCLLPAFGLLFYALYATYGINIAGVLTIILSFAITMAKLIFIDKRIIKGIFELIILLVVFYVLLIKGDKTLYDFILGPFGALLFLVMMLFYIYAHHKNLTQKGVNLQTHLFGFKEFLKRVKQDEIKKELEANPQYLEKMLPYAALFGVIGHWYMLFTVLDVAKPTWCIGITADMGELFSCDDDCDDETSSSDD